MYRSALSLRALAILTVLTLWTLSPRPATAQSHTLVNSEVDFAHGELAFAQKDYSAAISNFKKLAERDPGNARAHYWLGAAYFANGDKELAKKEFDTVVKIGEPKDFVDKSERYLAGMAGGRQAPKSWQVNLVTGFRYDSNLFLDPDSIPTVSEEGAAAWDVYVHGAYYPIHKEDLTVGMEYSFFNGLYFDHSDYSYMWHRAGFIVAPKFGIVSLLFRPNFSATFMDSGSDFYEMMGEIPLVARFDYSSWAASEVNYRFQIQDFSNVMTDEYAINNADLRDNIANYVGFDQYFYALKKRLSINLGVQGGIQNASNPYDFAGPQMHGRVGMLLPFDILAQVYGSYAMKFYFHDNLPAPGFVPNFITREDDVAIVGASVRKQLYGPLWGSLGYEFINNDSNEQVFDYHKHTGTCYLGVDF